MPLRFLSTRMTLEKKYNSGAFLLPDISGLEKASEILKQGGVVAVPTETVYGLAGNALSDDSLRLIFETKRRPLTDPLIVHVHSLEQVYFLAEVENNPLFEVLAKRFWPGAITFVLPKKSVVSDLITASKDSIAIRMPGHSVFRELLQLVDLPLAAPSANPFSYVSPTSAQHVYDSFGELVPVIDGGECLHGVESTVLSLLDPDELVVLRPGPVSVEEIQKVSSVPVRIHQSNLKSEDEMISPGMLIRHYSPKTPLKLFKDPRELVDLDLKNAVVVTLGNDEYHFNDIRCIEKLSETGDMNFAASQIFSILRKWDHADCDTIYFQQFPEEGIGIAANDRLRRAAAQ